MGDEGDCLFDIAVCNMSWDRIKISDGDILILPIRGRKSSKLR